MSIKIEDFSKVLSNELSLYSSKVADNVKKITDECTQEFVKNTKRDAPRGNRKKKKYYTYIRSKTINETPTEKINMWYVGNPEYRLTHLIKNGHSTRNGGRTKGNDFLNKNYDILENSYETRVKEAINNER